MNQKISMPGVYEGYTQEIYEMGKGHSVYVTMQDNVKIALDYYIPHKDGKEVQEVFPAVMILTPYPYRKEFNDKTIPIEDQFTLGEKLVKRGYVFVVADVRGTGISYGFRPMPNSLQEGKDAYELIEWLARQEFCNGNIGMAGFSYFGGTQMAALVEAPPHLKACFIGMTDLDKYDGWVRGGILRKFGTQPDAAYLLDLNNPPVDEDPDGILREEAVMQHKNSVSLAECMKESKYRDSYSELAKCDLWNTIGRSNYLDKINQGHTKVYLYGGWRDVFRRETITMYQNLKLPKKMIIGNWYHMDERPGFDLDLEHIRFFDETLKQIENGIWEEDPIYYTTVNGDPLWESAKQWPPKTDKKRLYLQNYKLSETLEIQEDPIEYVSRYDIQEDVDAMLTTTERQEKGLVYSTEKLDEDVCVSGHSLLKLYVSSTAKDGDLFVSLLDVDEDGIGRYVTDTIFRLSLRKCNENPYYDYMGLPWHRRNCEDEELLKAGEIAEIYEDFLPTSYVFKKGHKIQIAITTHCLKFWHLEDESKPVLSFYQNEKCRSYIELPVCKKER